MAYKTNEIAAIFEEMTQGTSTDRFFFIETTEDELMADSILIMKGGQTFAAATACAGAR